MRTFGWLLGACLFFSSFSSGVFAAQSEYLHQPVISSRVMGMGGAFVALADDYNALYYNVAGLARLEALDLNMGFQVGGTPQIISFYNDVKNAGSNVQNITSTLQNYYGSHYSSRVGVGGT